VKEQSCKWTQVKTENLQILQCKTASNSEGELEILKLSKTTLPNTQFLAFQLANRSIDYVINACIINKHKTKDVPGQGPANVNLSLFVCFFNVYRFLTISLY